MASRARSCTTPRAPATTGPTANLASPASPSRWPAAAASPRPTRAPPRTTTATCRCSCTSPGSRTPRTSNEPGRCSACLEQEEDEAQERCPVGELGPEQLTWRVWRERRLADDRDAEACLRERVRHGAQRAMQVRQHRALAI